MAHSKRKYVIEAHVSTLARFCNLAQDLADRSGSFIYRVAPNKDEDYYFVVLLASDETHTRLRNSGFAGWSSR